MELLAGIRPGLGERFTQARLRGVWWRDQPTEGLGAGEAGMLNDGSGGGVYVSLAGGAVTDTLTPKSLNVIVAVYQPIRFSGPNLGGDMIGIVSSIARTRPCWSTSTVALSRVIADSFAVNAYRVPVQPGPDADPISRTWPTEWSAASRSSGLTI